MTPAARIRKARLHAKFSQSDLASELGLSRSAASQWERFSGTTPSSENLERVAVACKVSYEWLATGRGSMKLGDTHQEPAAHMSEFAFDEQEARLLAGFRQLTARKRGAVVDLIEQIKS